MCVCVCVRARARMCVLYNKIIIITVKLDKKLHLAVVIIFSAETTLR